MRGGGRFERPADEPRATWCLSEAGRISEARQDSHPRTLQFEGTELLLDISSC